MKNSIVLALCLTSLSIAIAHAADFKQSKVTQVVNDVQIISAASQTQKAATVNDPFNIPDILRTGPASRAELVAADDTVTRVGANTIFSFDPANRTIDLKQGSLLFHSPHGQGGGTIHTGSATASVLGSTLIVTATKNGGFKVISLEDEANIKLPNGKQQTLKPGQMTFILPGNTQLAPIILFRLDDLTQHSLLVGGFNHPLASTSLINNEINKQTKLLKQGKVSDTGLLAGDNATPDQVEVLDANTVQVIANSESVNAALNADAVISQPSLKDASIPTPPPHVFLNPTFNLPNNTYFAGQQFSGFAARSIYFNPPGSNPEGLTMDMTPYANNSKYPEFDFVSAKDINFQGSVNFNGLGADNKLLFAGGDQIVFTPGVTVQADVGTFAMSTPSALTLDSVHLVNNTGDVSLTSGTEINLQNDTTIDNAGKIKLTAANAVNITSASDVNVGVIDPTGVNVGLSSETAINTDATSGRVTISSTAGSVNVLNTDIQTHYLTLNSGDSILLDAGGRTLAASGPGATANFTAPKLIAVNNANLAAYGVVNMAANTINLINVAFGADSFVSLSSKGGFLAANPNTGQISVPGAVNFIRNVTYGGNPAQDYIVSSGKGIIISKLP